MSLKKRMNKTIALGLIIGGMGISTHSVYAINQIETAGDDIKSNKKVELKVDEKEVIKGDKREIVTTSVLNVREKANKDSEKIATLTEGIVVEVLETKGEWDKIVLADEKEGWVSSEFTTNEKAKVNTAELNLRKGPSTDDDKIELLKRDAQLEVLSVLETEAKDENTKEMWYEVKIVEESKEDKKSEEKKALDEDKEEVTGWVFSELVLTESQETKLKEEEARREAEKKAKEKEAQKKNQTTQVSNTNSSSSNTNSSSSNTNSSSSNTNSSSSDKQTGSSLVGTTITVNASAYSGHTITATGTTPKWGTIAVDPKVIPYGTKVYIPMFDKVFIAEDCGGAIKGNKIDIFMNSKGETTSFGRRNIEIKILG